MGARRAVPGIRQAASHRVRGRAREGEPGLTRLALRLAVVDLNALPRVSETESAQLHVVVAVLRSSSTRPVQVTGARLGRTVAQILKKAGESFQHTRKL